MKFLFSVEHYRQMGLYSAIAGIGMMGALITSVALKAPTVLVVLAVSWSITFLAVARYSYLAAQVLGGSKHGHANEKEV